MKKLSKDRWLQTLAIAAGCAFAGPTLAAEGVGLAAFVTEGRTYLGQYSLADQALSVDIDGLSYGGHYAARADDNGRQDSAASSNGQWGRAFLFASSARVLQCQLKTGFPQVSGQCQGADGHQFELKPATQP